MEKEDFFLMIYSGERRNKMPPHTLPPKGYFGRWLDREMVKGIKKRHNHRAIGSGIPPESDRWHRC
jgi:hypothetical protein